MKKEKRKNVLEVTCIVTGKDEKGNIIARRVSEGDLILDQFGKFLAHFFREWYPYNNFIYLKDVSGTLRTINPWGYSDTGTYPFNDGVSSSKGAFIGIGSDGTSPSRSDYKLGSLIERKSAYEVPADYDSSLGEIRFSITFYYETYKDVRECGFYMVISDINKTSRTFLFFRNAFSVVNAKTFTVQYIIQI